MSDRDFENRIREMASQGNGDDPPKGHEERFMERLQQEQPAPANRRSAKVVPMGTWWAAAAVAAILLIGFALGRWSGNENGDSAPQVAEAADLDEVSPEKAEVEYYFIMAIAEKKKKLEKYGGLARDDIQQSLKMLEELDAEYEQLRKELAKNFGDTRIINAMIRNYQARLKILTRLLDELEKTERKTEVDYENDTV